MNRMDRRGFLALARQTLAAAAGSSAFLAAGSGISLGKGAVKPPHMIFILIDDLRFDAMGCTGHPWAKTPNIDRLAKEGVTFTNAFVTTSLCSPARASFLTGCYAHTNGVVVNGLMDPNPTCPTFPQLLQKAGYRTGFVGKWHMAATDEPRPGFDHWVSFLGQGSYHDCPLNVNGERVISKQHTTDELTDRAIEFVRGANDQPFMLYLSYKAVHGPLTPAERYKSLYEEATVQPYDRADDEIDKKPPWIQSQARSQRGNNKVVPARDSFEKDYQRQLASVDEGLGRLWKALGERGLMDDTVIIFAGDNGHLHGEHGGTSDKRYAYEESIRIPLLMRYPKLAKAGSNCTDLVLNIDLAPTLMDLSGNPPAAGMQGISWAPAVEGTGNGRESFLYEYFNESVYRRRGLGKVMARPTSIGIRTRRWKYVVYPESEGDCSELYDLKQDPYELHNLYKDPSVKDKLGQLKQDLEGLKRSTGFAFPKPAPENN